MAVRITHTNNSQGHDGTYVYRSTSPMDPQNLPAPIADEPPVALGATFEHIDNVVLSGEQYYRTQDHEGGQVSEVSAEVSVMLAEDYSTAQVGDEIGGGVYAGTITYADSRQFHIIASKDAGWTYTQWKVSGTSTSDTGDINDGVANTQAMMSASPADHPAAAFCEGYEGGGYTDWYMPAFNEIDLVRDNLRDDPIIANHDPSDLNTFSSTEWDASNARAVWFGSATSQNARPKTDSRAVMAIRRVPV